ncbi:RsmB/NOP family class I SAM-dependent RNA methyltransferase [Halocatena halophila]|uniref:RsmB/NOP family class I SAM-dependent RNA methyltransferase n=1 Tax=Halocatena halophila TaxID=2814576 RepID=UPI002ED39797
MILERYRELIDSFDAFLGACDRPLPSVVRVNTLKASVERVERALADTGYEYEQCSWYPELLRLSTDTPGNSWPYVHGWIYGQEEVSALPARVLSPSAGDRVLDTCAAPGSKTTQLAALMDDRGTLIANDANLGRLSALRTNAQRCGVTNLIVNSADAQTLSLAPFGGDPFDHALVDVPCSCEGTIRKNPTALEDWDIDHVRGLAGIQRGILRRAIQATRAGGTVVYSTCTFAPEENEAVLDAVLETESCRIVPFETALDTRPGVTEWNEKTFDRSVEKAQRIYPHLNDTGGFFCAKLEVTGE